MSTITEHTPGAQPAPRAGDLGQLLGRLVVRQAVSCMYYACMPNVQVRDVPEEIHETLVRRAERAGQSLQQFLTAQLALIAATPTIDEILDQIERRPTGRLSAKSAIAAIDQERARR